MKLNRLGPNINLLVTNHGYEILYSFDKAVAGYIPFIGYFDTPYGDNKDTARHIGQYLAGKEIAISLSSKQIENIFLETL